MPESDGGNGGGGGGINWPNIGSVPSWLDGKPKWWDNASSFLSNPVQRVRQIMFGTLLTGIAYFIEPILSAIQLIFVGSQPGTWAGANETYGMLDIPVLVLDLLGDAAALPISSTLDAFSSLIASVVPNTASPLNGILVTAVIVFVAVLVARYGPRVIRALLEAIPVLGGPISTLVFGGGD